MRIPLAVIALVVSAATAYAAAPAHIDLSGARCEIPQVTDAIRKSVRNMKLEDGTSLLNYMGNNSALKATTISAARDKLVCRVTINLRVNGQFLDVRGLYTIRLLPGDKLKSEFIPGY